MDLSTTYLGIPVKSPLIVGSCGLNSNLDNVKKMADAGAGAIVLKSIFEEEILLDFEKNVMPKVGPMENDLEFFDYYDYQIKNEVLEKHISLIQELKKKISIPVIASINCTNGADWIDYAKKLENSGVNGLELNLFKLPFDKDKTSLQIEQDLLSIVNKVQQKVNLPVAVKIAPHFTNLGEFVVRIGQSGVKGVVLFNRFFSIDFNIENESVVSSGVFSSPGDFEMPLRWISILSGKVDCDIIASTGIHSSETAIKMLLAGAQVVQLVSTVYKNGAGYIQTMNQEIEEWMSRKGYSSLNDFRGNMSQTVADKPDIYERVQFMRYFSDYSSPIL